MTTVQRDFQLLVKKAAGLGLVQGIRQGLADKRAAETTKRDARSLIAAATDGHLNQIFSAYGRGFYPALDDDKLGLDVRAGTSVLSPLTASGLVDSGARASPSLTRAVSRIAPHASSAIDSIAGPIYRFQPRPPFLRGKPLPR